jgi:hypothetical protein
LFLTSGAPPLGAVYTSGALVRTIVEHWVNGTGSKITAIADITLTKQKLFSPTANRNASRLIVLVRPATVATAASPVG